MDMDVFVATHRGEWARLEDLARRARRPRQMSAADVEELVRLYQQTATHLSIVQSKSPDPVVVARLSRLVADARAAIAGSRSFLWADVARFFTVTFPVTVYRARSWVLSTALVSLLIALAFGWWVATHPAVQHGLAPPQAVKDLTSSEFSDYYRSAPAHTFATHVWTNNVWVSASALIGGLTLGGLTVYMLFMNMLNVGVDGGYMIAAGKSGEFFGLILPHGMLELTAVFVAAGTGLRLGWTIIDPGPRRRTDALAAEVRAAVAIALGLIVVLGVSGAIEGFVTPSALPTWVRIGIGVIAETAFLGYVSVLGRRAATAGETGDLDGEARGDLAVVG